MLVAFLKKSLKVFLTTFIIGGILVGIYLFLPEYYSTLENNSRDIFFKSKGIEKPKNK